MLEDIKIVDITRMFFKDSEIKFRNFKISILLMINMRRLYLKRIANKL